MSNSMINTTGIKQLSTPTTTPTSSTMNSTVNTPQPNLALPLTPSQSQATQSQPPHPHPPSIFTSISPRNSITSFSNNRPNLTTNNNQRNYSISSSTTSGSGSPKRYSFSEYSNEQIIDLMEREQDAIVLKLMKEIQSLKQENKQLRLNQYNNSNNNNNNNNSPCITSTSNNTGIMSAPITLQYVVHLPYLQDLHQLLHQLHHMVIIIIIVPTPTTTIIIVIVEVEVFLP